MYQFTPHVIPFIPVPEIPDWVVAAGNPCRVIRKITEEDKKYYYKDRLFDRESMEELEKQN